MKRAPHFAAILTLGLAVCACAQSEAAYAKKDGEYSGGLLDPSRFSVNHAAIFGASSGLAGGSGLQSQSLYVTMLQYQFAAPITVNLDFGFPIHSTYNDASNLSQRNLESAEYFRNMPFNASITWQPADNFLMRISVARENYSTGFLADPSLQFSRPSLLHQRW